MTSAIASTLLAAQGEFFVNENCSYSCMPVCGCEVWKWKGPVAVPRSALGMAHFDESAQEMVCTYGSSFEETGGPLWLVRMADDLITAGLACLPRDPSPPPEEGYWIRAVLEQQPRLIASSQALAELAGEESLVGAPAIHVLFQGSLVAITELGLSPAARVNTDHEV